MARLAFDLSVLRVFLVEDDTFSREFEITALKELGITSITLSEDEDGVLDALERGTACDLIVYNWNMPLFDGVSLVGSVKQKWPGIPFLMLTNTEGLDQIKVAQDTGVDGCLIKPFSLDKLREAIQLALISKLTSAKSDLARGSKESDVDPELEKITASIKNAINSIAGDDDKNGNGSAETLKDANKLASSLTGQLTDFIDQLSNVNQPQMDVIQLHISCVQAVLSGRKDLLIHENQNLIVDGLNLAVDLVVDRNA